MELKQDCWDAPGQLPVVRELLIVGPISSAVHTPENGCMAEAETAPGSVVGDGEKDMLSATPLLSSRLDMCGYLLSAAAHIEAISVHDKLS